MTNAPLPLTPKHDWKFRTKSWVKIDCIHTQTWALWIINNLTKSNIELLKGIMPITIAQFGWLNEQTAGILCMIIEDRQDALMKARTKEIDKALDRGEDVTEMYPTFNKKVQREYVGAAICELVAQGYAEDFKKLVETK